MTQGADERNSRGGRSGPGIISYIAGITLAAIAGFALAHVALAPAPDRDTTASTPTASVATSQDAAQGAARAAESGSGLEKLVVHDTPRDVPSFSFIDGDGETRTLKDWRDKILLVNIWATWCAPCKEEMPALARLQEKLGGEKFAVLPISVDRGGLKKPRGFLEDIGAENLPLLLDESARLNVTLDVLGLPATLIIDEQGREIARMIGPAEWDSPEAIARLRQFMAAEG